MLCRNKSNRKYNSPRCAPLREGTKSEPEDGQRCCLGVFGCRVTQEPCKQNIQVHSLTPLTHWEWETRVIGLSYFIQTIHFCLRFIECFICQGLQVTQHWGPPCSLTGPGVHRESDLGFRTGIFVVVLGRSC